MTLTPLKPGVARLSGELIGPIRSAAFAMLTARPVLRCPDPKQTSRRLVQRHRNGDRAARATVLSNDDFLTGARFRRRACRLGTNDRIPQPKDDFLHDNTKYGRYIFTALAALY